VIRYAGNPYVDAGVAVLELRLQKPCAEFTEADLASQADWIKKEYRKKIWKSYLMLHLPNCAWTQANPDSDKNSEYIRKVLESYKPEFPALDRRCAFCNEPAKILADRRYVPLLTGETSMASGAEGRPGLPVCGYCVFAVHFYPLATLKVEGRPLFWSAPHPMWVLRLNRAFYGDVQRLLAASSDELPKLRWPATRLLNAARQVMDEIERMPELERPPLCDVAGLHATNYGTAASYDELRIPRGLLEFWSEAGMFGDLYRRIEQQAWESEEVKPKKKGRGKISEPEEEQPQIIRDASRRNFLYEALGRAFRSPDFREGAKRVAARFFMRRRGRDTDPNTTALAELFLEKVGGMQKQRLDAIRGIADNIADNLIIAGNDRKAAWALFRRRLKLGEFLQYLSLVQRKLSDCGHPFAWENFLLALGLESEEDRTASDHWIVQELILVRLYERLATSPLLSEIPEQEILTEGVAEV
jgi:CRISPR-associated protein Cst1